MIEVITDDGKKQIIQEDKCTVEILTEPSASWLLSQSLIVPPIQPPTTEERLAAAEAAILALMGV
jgi:hypothetical protein